MTTAWPIQELSKWVDTYTSWVILMFMSNDVISAHDIIRRALYCGLLANEEATLEVYQAAGTVANHINEFWAPGCGFGSSDMTVCMHSMLDHAGIPAGFVRGRLTRFPNNA